MVRIQISRIQILNDVHIYCMCGKFLVFQEHSSGCIYLVNVLIYLKELPLDTLLVDTTIDCVQTNYLACYLFISHFDA